jgi:hypothetical protein
VSLARSSTLPVLIVLCLGFAGCESQLTRIGAEADSGHYIEAESATLSGGFSVVSDSKASDGQLLIAPSVTSDAEPGDARAIYTFRVRTPGSYTIWGRIRSPDSEHNRFWVRVDDGAWMKWRISVGDIWYWDAFHDDVDYGNARQYPLDAGDHVLTLANCADNVQLDQLFYSSLVDDVPLGNDTLCNPPHSIELNGVCQPSCGSQGGNQCGTPCNDHHPFYAYDCGASCCYIAP